MRFPIKKVFLFILGISLARGAILAYGGSILTLEQAVSEAIANNALVRYAMEREKAAVETKKSATADFFPKLSASYSYERLKEEPYAIFENPLVPGTKYKVPVRDLNDFSWNISLIQPVFTGFALITKRQLAELNIDLRGIERQQAVLDVAKEAKIAYFRVLLAKRYVEIAKEEVDQLRLHLRDAKQFYDQGIIPRNDLLKSEVALAQAEQNLVKAKSNLKVAIANLNVVLERDIGEQTELEDVSSFKPKRYNLSELYREALGQRPELKGLEIAIRGAELRARLAKSNYYPKVYIIARYDQEGKDPGATENDFENSHNAVIGFQAEWILFEWGKRLSEVRQAYYEKLALEHRLKTIKDSIKLEVKDAFEKLRVATRNITTAVTALKQAKENFRITNLQYQQNVTTSTEVLDARTFLTQAEVSYFDALYGYMVAEAELVRAIGKK